MPATDAAKVDVGGSSSLPLRCAFRLRRVERERGKVERKLIPLPAGHKVGVRQKDNGRWVVECECGYGKVRWKGDTPKTCATEASALGQAVWHLRKMEAARTTDRRRDGLPPLPRSTTA